MEVWQFALLQKAYERFPTLNAEMLETKASDLDDDEDKLATK